MPEEETHLVASSLTLTDKQGIPRIVATTTDENVACFCIRDANGEERVQVSVGPGGASMISILKEEGAAQVQVSNDSEWGPSVTIRDDRNGTSASLRTIVSTGYPVLTLVGPKVGGEGISIGFAPDGSPRITGIDKSGAKTFIVE